MSVLSEERPAIVSHAVGMAAAQAECSVAVALLLLQREANVIGCDLAGLSIAVVKRRARFTRDSARDLLDTLTVPAA